MSGDQNIARAYVEKGRQIIEQQRRRVARLRSHSELAQVSHELLTTFEETQWLLEAHLARLEREIRP